MKTIPAPLGTILPTRASWAAADAYAENVARRQQTIAETELSQYEKRHEEGETRYYASPDRFAIVGRNLRILWFDRRADGHWYASK